MRRSLEESNSKRSSYHEMRSTSRIASAASFEVPLGPATTTSATLGNYGCELRPLKQSPTLLAQRGPVSLRTALGLGREYRRR